jgi:hypothetical protein
MLTYLGFGMFSMIDLIAALPGFACRCASVLDCVSH